MTPTETFDSIDAYFWRTDKKLKQQGSVAWLTARLMRTKRIPRLKDLFVEKARKLTGKELEDRKKEFAEMTSALDLSKINKRKNG